MTAAVAPADTIAAGASAAGRRALRLARARGIVIAALGVAAFGFANATMQEQATFSFWIDQQGGQALTIPITVGALWIVTGVLTGIFGLYQLWRGASVRWRLWLALVLPLWIAATIGTLLSGKPATLTNLFAGSLEYAFPISMGAFAAMICERSGMFDIAVEGKLLLGACVASIAASVTGIVIVGPIVAAIVGMGVGLLMAWLAIRYRVDQIISGTVVNFGALGLTNFIYLRILQLNTDLNTPPTVEAIQIPVLSHVPVIGPILFAETPYVYIAIVTMFVLTYMLFRTRWGLRLRAAGEFPQAAGTVGIDVIKIRYRAMIIAGALAGFAGSYLSLSSAGSFQMNMSAGKGFIGLAAMIFGGWNPIGAFGAALVFGFSDATQALLSILGVDVPPQLLTSVPYLVTIVVVAGVVGRVRGPAMAGQPYEQA
ncbi:MAG TPA: ABC transporter permease [Candidatus Limnocylindrales bacterium]